MFYFFTPKNNFELFSPQKKKIVLSPHYDDFILSLGGLAGIWQINGAEIEDIIVFSLTSFVNDNSNNDDLPDKITRTSAIRYQEEIEATNNLGKVKISRLGFYDVSARNKKIVVGGAKPIIFDELEKQIINDLIGKLNFWLDQSVQIFVPLAIRFHIDHLLIREAIYRILTEQKNTKAEIFFYEDLPYADTNKREWRPIKKFIRQNKLFPITYGIDLEKKLGLIGFYPSQFDKKFYTGVIMRSMKLAFKSLIFRPSERVYYYKSDK